MKRTITAADRAASQLFRQQGDLITRSQALAAGLTKEVLRRRTSQSGPWQVVLPGIYLAHNGGLTLAQREVAAVLYAGNGCVLTGLAALRVHGLRTPLSEVIDVLIPAAFRRQGTEFIRIHRTTRMPEHSWQINGIRYAPAARAVADAVRGQVQLNSARALVAEAVQHRACTVEQLAAELRAGSTQGSGALRAALEEVAAGVRSVAEGDLRKLIVRCGLPEPMYNARLFVGEAFLARPDAWWADAGVACEVDSREWHLSPEGWERTQARHARMSAHGILVLHYAPRRIRSDSAAIASELRATLAAGRQRPPLPIRALPVS